MLVSWGGLIVFGLWTWVLYNLWKDERISSDKYENLYNAANQKYLQYAASKENYIKTLEDRIKNYEEEFLENEEIQIQYVNEIKALKNELKSE